jgi:uncharacterized protein YegP (UPF0339 family)
MDPRIGIVAIILFAIALVGCHSIAKRIEPTEPRPYMIRMADGSVWRIVITAKNGEDIFRTLAHHDGERVLCEYERTRNAVINHASPSVIEADQDGRFHWLHRNESGLVVATSDGSFSTRSSALGNFEDVRAALLAWPPDDVQVINDDTL